MRRAAARGAIAWAAARPGRGAAWEHSAESRAELIRLLYPIGELEPSIREELRADVTTSDLPELE